VLQLLNNLFSFTANSKPMQAANYILQTERLLLRQLTLTDTPFIIELLNTEGWIKYIGDRNVKTAEQARQYLSNGPIKSYADNGFGLYMVALQNNHIPIGMCGLIKRDYLPHPDIGYAFLPQYAGQGYAFEAAKAVLQYAFNHLQKEKILAITLADNASSVKLLQKLGMQYEEDFIDEKSNETLARYGISHTGK
jgi:RimJ/RimL family protein N-acetyltransferase